MDVALWIIAAGYAPIVLAWLIGCVWLSRLRQDPSQSLSPLPDVPADPALPSLTVLVAAHNEQERIEGFLSRVLSQNVARLDVIVANDRSTDDTAPRARVIAARDPRVQVVDVERLPDGWIGKTHALARAAERARGDCLLFLDCDCRLSPGALAALLRHAVNHRIDFASLWPHLELNSFAERLLTPPAAWLLGVWAAWDAVRHRGRGVEMGNGQFLMLTRAAYDRIGGHASVAAELTEDIALARRAAEAGLRCWSGLGRDLYVTTRQNRWPAAVQATARVWIGTLRTPARLLWSTQLLLGGIVTPMWILPLSAAVGTQEWGSVPAACALTGLGILHWAAMVVVARRLSDLVFTRQVSPVSFMVGGLLCVGVVVRAWRVATGRALLRWGRTEYRVRGTKVVRSGEPST